jgi:hypothetical protein
MIMLGETKFSHTHNKHHIWGLCPKRENKVMLLQLYKDQSAWK